MMDLMRFMESMGTSGIPLVAAFFIGLMMAISPCPLATNMTAIAYVSRRIDNGKHTLLVGLLYTLGRMLTYVAIAASIVYFGLGKQEIALSLQRYGGQLIGPVLIVIGLIMLEAIRLDFIKLPGRSDKLEKKLADKGYAGSFLLGVVFALAFCPFSAVLFFGMLIPLALKTGDAIMIPSVFAFATGLPVILFSVLLVTGVGRVGQVMNKVQEFERWTRRIVAVLFLAVGAYYTLQSLGVIF
jgi:cytochrome c-type biogenesis protein